MKTVLIIDDEPELARYHAAILEQAGMVPVLVTDPLQAVGRLADVVPDLILIDMYMPGCTGLDGVFKVPATGGTPVALFPASCRGTAAPTAAPHTTKTGFSAASRQPPSGRRSPRARPSCTISPRRSVAAAARSRAA